MAYRYDIFISYKWHPRTLAWIREHFLPVLDHSVSLELDHELSIFVHEANQQVTAGTAWHRELEDCLSDSRVLVPLWTGNYLTSPWCAEELAHMVAREELRQQHESGQRFGLIIPVLLHDGDPLPEPLRHIQRLDLKRFFNPWMRKDGAKAEELGETLRLQAPGFASAILHAPEWQKNWPAQRAAAYFDAFYRSSAPVMGGPPEFPS